MNLDFIGWRKNFHRLNLLLAYNIKDNHCMPNTNLSVHQRELKASLTEACLFGEKSALWSVVEETRALVDLGIA